MVETTPKNYLPNHTIVAERLLLVLSRVRMRWGSVLDNEEKAGLCLNSQVLCVQREVRREGMVSHEVLGQSVWRWC